MIVTCDHCGTRYKLDDSKIPERGARITCPSCRHVFAVYRTPPPSAATLPPTAVSTVAPEAAATASAVAARPSVAEEAAQLDTNALNFRDVGIASWKVKVKIGLVYDFNDFKTLNKYIRDGRVSGSDLLSHDGSSWVPMEAIGDLEQHFRETFVRARRAMEPADDDEIPEDEPTRVMTAPVTASPRAAASKPKKAPAKTSAVDGDLAAAFAAAAAEADGEDSTSEPARTGRAGAERRFVDPFEAQQNRKRSGSVSGSTTTGSSGSSSSSSGSSKTSPPPTGSSSGATMGLAALVVLGLLGGGYYVMTNNSGASTPTTPVQVSTVTPPPPPTQEAAAARIQRELMEAARERTGEPPPNPDYEEEQPLQVVVPEQFRKPEPGSAEAMGLENGSYSVQDQTAADHFQAGSAAAASNDWRRAAQSFKKAVDLAPTNSSYLERLGEAQYQLGEADKARGTLSKASSRGSTLSLKYLGHIAFDQGDESGAMGFYRRYLGSNPPDRQDIEQRISALSGG